jgi:hypothetical protein
MYRHGSAERRLRLGSRAVHSPAVLDRARRRWDLCEVSADRDDQPAHRRGAVFPPPSQAPDDTPALVVPRMEPPPASLEAMVHSRREAGEATASWPLWLALLVIAAAVTGYVLR